MLLIPYVGYEPDLNLKLITINMYIYIHNARLCV